MARIWREVRLAVRTLWRAPTFSAVVILTVGISLAANATVMAVVDALILRPFPLRGIDRLVEVFGARTEGGLFADRGRLAPADFLDWQGATAVAEELVALRWWDASITGTVEPERIQAFRVSPAFFRVLGVDVGQGRGFLRKEGDWGSHRVAVIGHGLWERRFAADPSMVGRTVRLDGETFTVVGIAPERFDYPVGAQVWTPLAFTPDEATERGSHNLRVIGRLRRGQTVEALEAELAGMARRLEKQFPTTNRGWSVNVLPLAEAVRDIGAGAFLLVWQVSALLLLIIACANVANLLLARGTARQRELALRAALGAGRRRIVGQLLTESGVLALTGAMLAVPLTWLALRAITSTMPANIARFVRGWDQIDVDGRLLMAMTAIALGAALVFGLVPALRASRVTLTEALAEGGRGTGAGMRRRLRSALVVAEVALCLTLLVAAGLSVRGTMRVITQFDGYDPDGILTMRVTLPETKYDRAAGRRFFERLVDGVTAFSGVERASATNILPSEGNNASVALEVEGHEVAPGKRKPEIDYRVVTPGFFRVLRLPIVAGRGFSTTDREDALAVAIVSRAAAQRFWPGEDPLGRRVRIARDDQPWRTIVGVAGDVRHDWFLNQIEPTIYVPFPQAPEADMALAIRGRADPAALTTLARNVLRGLDPDQPVYDVYTMRQIRGDRAVGLKYAASLMAGFGAIGLLLAAVGVYAVMAYTVSLRTQEIGVRMALGAGRREIWATTVGQGLWLTAWGLALGLVGAFGLGKLMESTLFGTVRLDAASFVAFPVFLAVVATAATFFPARRAMRVDPVIALRAQ